MSNNIEQTLSIIKPDAVERNLIENIKSIFIEKKLKIKEDKKIHIPFPAFLSFCPSASASICMGLSLKNLLPLLSSNSIPSPAPSLLPDLGLSELLKALAAIPRLLVLRSLNEYHAHAMNSTIMSTVAAIKTAPSPIAS